MKAHRSMTHGLGELRWGLMLLVLFLARQALFGETGLRLRDSVVAGPQTTLGALFENRGGLAGPVLHRPLDLAPGYHYLDSVGIRQLLAQASPALSNLNLIGDGVRVYVQKTPDLPDPLSGRPDAFGTAPGASQTPGTGGEGNEMFLFSRVLEGRSVIPRGTQVLIGRDGGKVLLQLTGSLVKDFDFSQSMKIRLAHGGVTLERWVNRDQVVFY